MRAGKCKQGRPLPRLDSRGRDGPRRPIGGRLSHRIGMLRKVRIAHWLWPRRFLHGIGMLRVGRIAHWLWPKRFPHRIGMLRMGRITHWLWRPVG